MTKPKLERKQVRVVERASILGKRFKRVFKTSKQIDRGKVHPLFVLADLRKGSLASLARYLAQEKGIPDRAVAIELRKLISGSAYRSRYRLVVVDHPGRPKDEGGRPSEPQEDTLVGYQSMVAKYEEALPLERGKKHLARQVVATEFKCSDATVKRAIRIVRDAQEAEVSNQRNLAEVVRRREAALSRLREKVKGRST